MQKNFTICAFYYFWKISSKGRATATHITMMQHEMSVDYFSLHNRKKKDVDIEMLDYEYVAKCTDVDLLKNILAVLQSGKEGKYPPLEKAAEERLLELLPKTERDRVLRMKSEPSNGDIDQEKHQLASWETEIERKSAALEEEVLKKAGGPRQMPPVRGRSTSEEINAAKTSKTAVERKSESNAAKKAIPAYDWRAWEKYDVEAAEKEIDMEDERRKKEAERQREDVERRAKQRAVDANMTNVDVESMTVTERSIYAQIEKQKGNESFKCGENDVALLYYSRSLVYDPSSAIVYANRALTHLRLSQFSAAEADCTSSIACDPSYFKAWSRRGMTRFRRGKYEEAIADFDQALVLEPGNREIERLRAKTEEKWLEVDGTRGGTIQSETEASTLTSSSSSCRKKVEEYHDEEEKALETAPPSRWTRSGQGAPKPFQRFEIIDDDEEDEDDDDDDDAGKESYEAVAPEEQKPFQRFEILED